MIDNRQIINRGSIGRDRYHIYIHTFIDANVHTYIHRCVGQTELYMLITIPPSPTYSHICRYKICLRKYYLFLIFHYLCVLKSRILCSRCFNLVSKNLCCFSSPRFCNYSFLLSKLSFPHMLSKMSQLGIIFSMIIICTVFIH